MVAVHLLIFASPEWRHVLPPPHFHCTPKTQPHNGVRCCNKEASDGTILSQWPSSRLAPALRPCPSPSSGRLLLRRSLPNHPLLRTFPSSRSPTTSPDKEHSLTPRPQHRPAPFPSATRAQSPGARPSFHPCPLAGSAEAVAAAVEDQEEVALVLEVEEEERD